MNRRSGVKMFLSVKTAPLVLAKLIDFLIGRCHVNTPWCSNIHPQIWSATLDQDINTSAPILLALWMFISWIRTGKLVSSSWPKFAALRLFVETTPVKESARRTVRCHITLEKSSKNCIRYESEPSQAAIHSIPPPTSSRIGGFWGRIFHVVKENVRVGGAVATRHKNSPFGGGRAGWSADWYHSIMDL